MAHVSGVGAFFIIVLFMFLIGLAAWIVYTRLRARRLGLPQPTLASYNPFNRSSSHAYGGGSGQSQGGITGWFGDKFRAIRNRSSPSAGGAYEENLTSNVGGGRASTRGFGPLDPDDAWDARVGTEADAYGPHGYDDEHELSVHQPGTGPTPLSAPPGYDEERGRALNRGREPYTGGLHSNPVTNPFDDSAEPSNASLRGVSPRPVADARGQGHLKGQESIDTHHSERRSLFHEDM
jgi:hypothetical protein